MADKIDSSFGVGSVNYSNQNNNSTRQNNNNNSNGKNFGEFLNVDDRDDDLSAQSSEDGDAQQSDSNFSSPFGSFFKSISSDDNDDSSNNQSADNPSSSSQRPDYRATPGREYKPEYKPDYRNRHEVGRNIEPHETKPAEKPKEIQPTNNPLAAFQVPMQVDRVNAPMPVEKTPHMMPDKMLDQIVQEVRLGVNARGEAEFQFDLKSDVLEGLKLKISSKDGHVSASFIAENVHVKDAIDQGAQDLIKALQARGLEVANFNVSVGADTSGSGQGQQGQHQQQQQQQQAYTSGNAYSVSGANRGGDASDADSANAARSNTDYTI
jgi:hypothetical protein